MTKTKDPGPILVAIDFSADSEAALLWASNYTKCSESPLIILHIIHDPAAAPGFYHKEENDWSKPMAAVANRMSEDFMKSTRPYLLFMRHVWNSYKACHLDVSLNLQKKRMHRLL